MSTLLRVAQRAVLALPLVLFAASVGAVAPAAAAAAQQTAPTTNAAAHANPLLGFGADDRVVFTYYFYWYQYSSGRHVVDPDGSDALTEHPADEAALDYADPAWHEQQLRDMDAAGIDVALPVYWGSPQEAAWAQTGLDALSQALQALADQHVRVPAIGMFFDTSALAQVAGGRIDLSTPRGEDVFYGMIHDFFSRIPRRFWARIDGHPIVWLYSAGFVKNYGPTLFQETKRRFAADFGVTPYIVKEVSWHHIQADATYAWGAALHGPSFYGVATVGPGYDDSAVPGRNTPIQSRADGNFYKRGWQMVLAHRPKWVAIETWNEFHEGTEIAPTREYARTYVDLTRQYVDRFESGAVPKPPPGPYSGATQVSTTLGSAGEAHGLRHVPWEDGVGTPVTVDGRSGLELQPSRFPGYYLYFAVDDSFASFVDEPMRLTLTYLDRGRGSFFVEYDSTDHAATLDGAYTPTARVQLTDSGTFKTATIDLPHAFLANRENGGSDLRINASQSGLVIASITLTRRIAAGG